MGQWDFSLIIFGFSYDLILAQRRIETDKGRAFRVH